MAIRMNKRDAILRKTDTSPLQPYKGPINGPCSACGDGDTAMEYHNHEPPPKKYTLKEIEALAKEWNTGLELTHGEQRVVDWAVSNLIAHLARREREGRG